MSANLQSQTLMSNVPISQPIFYPDAEVIDMNGFSWSPRYGLIISTRSTAQEILQFMGNQK
jgi:hypothetical protein